MLWPDEISTAILERCDGTADVRAIARGLAREYDAPETEIETDLIAFLQDWSDRLLIDVTPTCHDETEPFGACA
ncbi:PqqD family protein [Breoghania sp.]|uniref:PqqD family protein n=1 Tax=Breoghania sp. TaxID=2065378 RepID=UPI0026163F70|nr:PqqD family protein [Breoghania sp.]MDJ0930438.1 PqqD family protein [Breoghania sp.]